MTKPPPALANLARAFLAGRWDARQLRARGRRACPGAGAWVPKIIRRLIKEFKTESPPTFDAVLTFLTTEPAIQAARGYLVIGEYFWLPEVMTPGGPVANSWAVPALTSAGQLADWLAVSPGLLDWLADVRGWTVEQPSERLKHYVCRWQPRRRGRFRLIESPKPTLKQAQRQILREILDRIPPHPAAHGFRPGRSILTYAAPHAGRRIVLRFDLRDFFPSVPASRVHALFRTAGYPAEVARLLNGLCTSRVGRDGWEQRPAPRAEDSTLWERLRVPHLPQGAPTSPALANLCVRRLDVRLHGLAESMQATYTRYADDLAFSGSEMLERAARRFQVMVGAIALEEGFELHYRKSRFMRRGVCQQLAGVVVNERPNVRRAVFDELKAILTNCLRHGPATQNRAGHADFRAHLRGRIAHVRMLHPARGEKLMKLFDRIEW